VIKISYQFLKARPSTAQGDAMPKYRFRTSPNGERIELEANTPEEASDMLSAQHPDNLVECLFVDDQGGKFLFSEDDEGSYIERVSTAEGHLRVLH
jgi:hypothetical protein